MLSFPNAHRRLQTLLQVQRDKPRLEGKPVCVVQYNPSGNIPSLAADDDRVLQTAPNSIIALSYVRRGVRRFRTKISRMGVILVQDVLPCLVQEARARGLKRSMRADEALKACPEAVLIQVRLWR